MIRQYVQDCTGFAKKEVNNLVKITNSDLLGNRMSDSNEDNQETYFQYGEVDRKKFCSWCNQKVHGARFF